MGTKNKTPKIFKTKDFLKMKAVWYRKLKEDGFRDVELGTLNGAVAQEGWSRWPASKGLRSEADTLRHQFLYTYSFKSERDREIWHLYTEGAGRVEGGKYRRNQIYITMRKLRREFKKWLKAECEGDGTLFNLQEIDYAEIIRELEMEDANRGAGGYRSMKAKGEVWDGTKWARTGVVQ